MFISMKKRITILIFTSMIILMFVIVTLLLIASFYLLKNIIKIKVQNHEISKYNELRKAFIDSSEHLIYIKQSGNNYRNKKKCWYKV